MKLNNTQVETFKRLLLYLGRYRRYLILSLLFALVNVILTLSLPMMTGEAIDLMLGEGRVDLSGILRILLGMGVIILLSALCQYFMNLCNNKMAYDVARDLRLTAFQKIERLPLSYLDRHPAGELESRLIADVDQITDGLLIGLTQLFSALLTIVGVLLFLLRTDVTVTVVVVIVTPLSLLAASFIASKTYRMFLHQSDIRGQQTNLIHEMVEGQKVVRAYNQQEQVIGRFDECNEKLKEASHQASFFSSLTNPTTRFVNSLVYGAVGLSGAFRVLGGGLTIGSLTACLTYANQYTKPFNEISGVITELQGALACAGRVFELIDEDGEVPDGENALSPSSFAGQVEWKDVSFGYLKNQLIIRDFNLSVKPGQKIAIVGPTGCGKTTLINLLMRFYDINSGMISIDGTPIRELTRHSLRSGFGMVLQDTWLKSGSIRDNLTMGNPTVTEEELVATAKLCHVHSFVKRLPQGYDTIIKENGEEFSQGQRQLLCIARVMISRPSMLILDEATSSIDTRTELKIQDAFNALMEGKTSFIVAHRLSTIQNADMILVMKDGKILERGSHSALMKKKQFYYELYRSQFAGVRI